MRFQNNFLVKNQLIQAWWTCMSKYSTHEKCWQILNHWMTFPVAYCARKHHFNIQCCVQVVIFHYSWIWVLCLDIELIFKDSHNNAIIGHVSTHKKISFQLINRQPIRTLWHSWPAFRNGFWSFESINLLRNAHWPVWPVWVTRNG